MSTNTRLMFGDPIYPDGWRSGSSSSRQRSGPTDADWEQRRRSIEELYLAKNSNLTEVMDAMEKKHGFIASRKMYKTRFNKWGWHKYQSKGREQAVAAGIPVLTTHEEKSCHRQRNSKSSRILSALQTLVLRPPLRPDGEFVGSGNVSGTDGDSGVRDNRSDTCKDTEIGGCSSTVAGSTTMSSAMSNVAADMGAAAEMTEYNPFIHTGCQQSHDPREEPYNYSSTYDHASYSTDTVTVGLKRAAGSADQSYWGRCEAISPLGEDVFLTEEYEHSPTSFV